MKSAASQPQRCQYDAADLTASGLDLHLICDNYATNKTP